MGIMDLGKIGETIKTVPGRAGAFVKGSAEKLKCLAGEKAGPLADRLLSRIPREKQKPLLFCLGGTVVILICLILITLVSEWPRKREALERAEFTIPPEDLFFPGEPDFVPSLLLEREPRRFWTPGDIAPFWEDPGEAGRDQWVKEMELVIDKLMEDVP
jgi:hypothetical protein